MDPLGQGVSKQNGEVFFVPKTLPGETVVVEITKKSKGVNFCKLIEILETSPHREEPHCPHYHECNGCHYLQTDYEKEIEFKRLVFEEYLNRNLKLNFNKISFIKAPNRFHYRNRVQLHFNKRKNDLGFKNKQDIVKIPNCLLPISNIGEEVRRLYSDDSWKTKFKSHQGHAVIESINENVLVHENEMYSGSGFRQVNESMNKELKLLLVKLLEKMPSDSFVIDLFGGSGNLVTDLVDKHQVLTVDSHVGPPLSPGHEILKLDVYKESSLDKVINFTQKRVVDCLILDPPRSGLKGLNHWVAGLKPKHIIYVSCSFQTQVRDLNDCLEEGYKIEDIYQLDLFPSTHHFETLISLRKKDSPTK